MKKDPNMRLWTEGHVGEGRPDGSVILYGSSGQEAEVNIDGVLQCKKVGFDYPTWAERYTETISVPAGGALRLNSLTDCIYRDEAYVGEGVTRLEEKVQITSMMSELWEAPNTVFELILYCSDEEKVLPARMAVYNAPEMFPDNALERIRVPRGVTVWCYARKYARGGPHERIWLDEHIDEDFTYDLGEYDFERRTSCLIVNVESRASTPD